MKKRLAFILTFMLAFVSIFAFGFKAQSAQAAVTEEQLQAEIDNISVPQRVIFDFPVVSVSVYGSTIEWESSDSSILNVPTSGGWVKVTRPVDADATVTLTVTLTNGSSLPKSKEFSVSVPKGTTTTNTYNIVYELNGGTQNESNSDTYKVGETKELYEPTKGALEFLGWYDNAEFNGSPLTALPKGISGDFTVYAKWANPEVNGIVVKTNPTKVSYNALETFDATGIVVEKTFNYGENEVVENSELSFDLTTLHVGNTKVVVTYGTFTAEVPITVSPIDYTEEDYTLVFDDKTVTYNGENQVLPYTFTSKHAGLTASLSPVVSKEVGTYDYKITFANTNADYNTPASVTKTLTINKAPLIITADNKGVKVGLDIPEFTASYFGFQGEDDKSVLNGTLTFTCSASKGSPKGTYNIEVSGVTSDNYEISFVKGTLTITEGTYTIVASGNNVTYNGSNQMFTVKLMEGDVEVPGIEFTYTFGDEAFTGATNAGTYNVLVSYNDATYGTGSQTVTFTIAKATYDMSGVSFTDATLTYNGEIQNLLISGTLPEGVSVSYSEGLKDVGSKLITATFTGDAANYNLIASKKATLTIEAKALEEGMFDSIPEQAFTGSAITPAVTGKFGTIELVEGTDFEVAYAENTAKGTAKVTVTGKGNYSDTVELTFVIGDSSLEKVKAGRIKLETKYASSLAGTIASDLTSLDIRTSNGCDVQWGSNTTAFSVKSDGTISMIKTETEQEVTLVATVTDGKASEQTTFIFTIPAGEVIQTKTIQEMIDAPVDASTYYKVTGIVSNITNTTDGYFDLVDPTNPSIKIYVWKLLTSKDGETGKFNTLNIVEGDTLTLIGTRGEYKSKIEIVDAYHVSHEKTTVSVSTDYESTQGTVVLDQPTVENGTEVTITINPAEGYEVSSVKAIVNGVETAISKNAEGEYKYVVLFDTSIAVEFALEGTTPTTLTLNIGSIAKIKGWKNDTKYSELPTGDANISVVATGSTNTGKYYVSGENWRIYQSESATVKITAVEGYSIISVKVTYSIKNTGTLVLNEENIASGTLVEVNGSSITFTVGNTGTVSNGQAQITEIEVVYQPIA